MPFRHFMSVGGKPIIQGLVAIVRKYGCIELREAKYYVLPPHALLRKGEGHLYHGSAIV